MSDPFPVIGQYQRFIQQLSFFVAHIRNQEGKENVQALDFGSQQGFFILWPVQQVIGTGIRLPDLHDIDTAFGCG